MDTAVTPRDRLSFTVFLAASLHAAVILGVGFAWHMQRTYTPTIEVTLARHDDRAEPEHADFLAQTNQLGSGDGKEVRETSTSETAPFHDSVAHPVMQQATSQPHEVNQTPTLTTVSASEQSAPLKTTSNEDPRLTPAEQRRLLDLSQEIASLDANLDTENNPDARAPRVRRLTSVSARRTSDAYYLESWRRKVEAVGNLNYPEEARRQRLYGSLRMLVAIKPDGELKEVRILDSSGHKVLDDAALRIVRLAAPFAPFPEEMRQSTDVLEIIRTWEFRRNRYSSS